MKDELLQIFPTPLVITKYEGSLVDELKHINTLDWIEQKANGNFKSKDTYLLDHEQFKNIKNFICTIQATGLVLMSMTHVLIY